ncbi:MAG TPA: TonB family protein [Alphaproteobacteria bacterium]
MTPIRPIELALALVLAGAVHGAALVGLAVRAPEPAREETEPLVYLQLAALDASAEAPDGVEPQVAATPSPPPPADAPPPVPEALPLPETPELVPPPDLAPVEIAPAPVEVAALEPPADAPPPLPEALPRPEPPVRLPVEIDRPRAKPAPPVPAIEAPPPAQPAVAQTPVRAPMVTPRQQVASLPAVVPPQAVPRNDGRGDALAAYAGELYKLINRTAVTDYPRQAARRGDQGVVPVRLTVGARGELVAVTVVDESAASSPLVRAAVAAVEKAAPFPAFAAAMDSEAETFEVSIVYKLR